MAWTHLLTPSTRIRSTARAARFYGANDEDQGGWDPGADPFPPFPDSGIPGGGRLPSQDEVQRLMAACERSMDSGELEPVGGEPWTYLGSDLEWLRHGDVVEAVYSWDGAQQHRWEVIPSEPRTEPPTGSAGSSTALMIGVGAAALGLGVVVARRVFQ